MKNSVLVRGARQLVTLHGSSDPRRGDALGDLGIIADGAVLIRNGIIAEVGPSRRVENLASARKAFEIDASGKLILPGFVDCHTHLVSARPNLADPDGASLDSTVQALRKTPGPRLRTEAVRLLRIFEAHGTTTLEAKSGYGLDEPGEFKTLRLLDSLHAEGWDIVPTFLGAQAVPPEFAHRAGDYLDWIIATLLPNIARRGLAQFADIGCHRGAFTSEQARHYLSAARSAGLELKLHANTAALAVEMGATSADHLLDATEEDARLLARSDTVATLLPGAVFHSGSTRYAPARMLIDSGAAVALATGFNPGTSPTLSMPMVLALACTQMGMTPAEALSAATINAACAIRADSRVGSLEFGKEANLVIYDAADYREIPDHFGVNLVRMTIRRGEIVYHAKPIG